MSFQTIFHPVVSCCIPQNNNYEVTITVKHKVIIWFIWICVIINFSVAISEKLAMQPNIILITNHLCAL